MTETTYQDWLATRRFISVKNAGARKFFAYAATTTPGTTYPTGIVEGAWSTIDLSNGAHWSGVDPNLPNPLSVVALLVRVYLVITHNGAAGIAQLRFTTRADKRDPLSFLGYQGHAEVAATNDGVRQQTTLIAPVYRGKSQVWWERVLNNLGVIAGTPQTSMTGLDAGITANIEGAWY